MCIFPFETLSMVYRRIILWVDSVPSPGKSKILSELKVRLANCEMKK